MPASRPDPWADGAGYERYIGRWSALVARAFVQRLGIPSGRRWLDVGCGSGAVTAAVLLEASPDAVDAVDPSETYVSYARAHVADRRARFAVGDMQALRFDAETFDVAVSGLVLNFVPRPEVAARELARVTREGGTVAGYVWDYAGEMQLVRRFWEAAAELDPEAARLDEGVRFGLAAPAPLAELFRSADLDEVRVEAIEVPTVFCDFDDYWTPFLGGQGPAGLYAASLDERRRAELAERLRERLPRSPDGSIALVARAWAVRGQK